MQETHQEFETRLLNEARQLLAQAQMKLSMISGVDDLEQRVSQLKGAIGRRREAFLVRKVE